MNKEREREFDVRCSREEGQIGAKVRKKFTCTDIVEGERKGKLT